MIRFVTYAALEGLANRLRVHLVADAYALHTGRRLLVDWPSNHAFGAHFGDLFQTTHWTDIQRLPMFLQAAVRLGCTRRQVRFNNDFLGSSSTLEDLTRITSLNVFFGEGIKQHATYRGGEVLGRYREAVLQRLRPTAEMSTLINRHTSRLPKLSIGVHIRRGDFCISFPDRMIGLQQYLAVCHEIRERCPDIGFYVCSDDPNAVARFHSELPCVSIDRVSYIPAMELTPNGTVFDFGNRGSLVGAREAVIDMWCLAATSGIIGSPASSFTEMASLLGNNPVAFPGPGLNLEGFLSQALESRRAMPLVARPNLC